MTVDDETTEIFEMGIQKFDEKFGDLYSVIKKSPLSTGESKVVCKVPQQVGAN